MRATKVVFIILQLSAASVPPAADTVELGGKNYYFSTDELNWKNASDFCLTMGAKLAEPKTEKDNNLIQEHLTKLECASYYIGLSSSDGMTFLYSSSGDPLTNFSAWNKNQPKELASPMRYVRYQCAHFKWTVNDGNSKIHYICEMLDPTTTTSTTPRPTSAPTVTGSVMVDTTPLVNASKNETLQNVSTKSQSVTNWDSGACALVTKAVSLTTLTTLVCFVFGLQAHF